MSARRALGQREWEDVRRGRPLVVLGSTVLEAPRGSALLLVRVRCERGGVPLAPVTEARQAMQRLLAEPSHAGRDSFSDLCERLRATAPDGAAVVFEAVDRADEATLGFLRRSLLAPEGFAVPLVLTLESSEPQGSAALLVDAVRATGGRVVTTTEDAFLVSEDDETPREAWALH